MNQCSVKIYTPEQGKMFWVTVRELDTDTRVSVLGVHGVHKLGNSGILGGERLIKANRLTARKTGKHMGLQLT